MSVLSLQVFLDLQQRRIPAAATRANRGFA